MPRHAAIVVISLLVGLVTPAYAYIDPGAGSALLQLLLAGAAGVLLLLRRYFGKLKAHFSRDKGGSAKPQ